MKCTASANDGSADADASSVGGGSSDTAGSTHSDSGHYRCVNGG